MLVISPPPKTFVYDPVKARVAAAAQANAPGWLIMWRCWRRCFTAWECSDPEQVRIIEAPTIEELLAHMQLVAVELWSGSSPSPVTGPSTDVP